MSTGLFSLLGGSAHADMVPTLKRPEVRGAKNQGPDRPPAPRPCIRKEEKYFGPRGPYKEVTVPTASTTIRSLSVTPEAAYSKVYAWLTASAESFAACYRIPREPMAPAQEIIPVSALFAVKGTPLGLAVLSLNPRLDIDCMRASFLRGKPLAAITATHATAELVFGTTCSTFICPEGPALHALRFGRISQYCSGF